MHQERDGDVVVLVPESAFMGADGDVLFERAYLPLLAETRRLIIDLTGLEELDSKRIAALVVFYKRAVQAGCTVAMCGAGPVVQSILRITRVDQVFPVLNTRWDAVMLVRREHSSSAE